MSRLEKATDLIVFSKLRETGYVDGSFEPLIPDVQVWAKKSSNAKINNILKESSKRKTGEMGYPEYLIYDSKNEVVIVIENKKSSKKHIYKVLTEKVDEYAVNGALWYASFLKKEFDVIAIGVSGNSIEDLLIDSFVWRKNADTFNNLNLSSIFPVSKYIELIRKSKVERSGKEALIRPNDKAKEINEFLRNILGVIEHKRLYVLGAILYALEDPIFKMSYAQTNNTEELSTFIYQTVERKVKGSNLQEKEAIINELKPVLGGLKNAEKEGVKELYPNGSLLELVKTVDNVLFEFHKNSELDLMSTFFNVFLSYSTSGGSDLGIVLTPNHVTRMFCDLAQVNLKSKILDICAGTGGFLTSAWKRIALDSSVSVELKDNFRNNNIYGVEKERSIYAIVALNMFINKDGRSNLFLGDAFVKKDEIKNLKCNVGFLNPPYSDSIYSEISFVELLLDSLLPNSIGVAVIPVNAVSSRTKKHSDILDVKRRILNKHNLLASIQMPTNLFYPKGTETIVLVFETGKPNSGNTWLARYNDGYELIKHSKTRTPTAKSDELYKNLINAFRNKEETDFSFNKEMKYDDQWVYTVHEDVNYKLTTYDLQEVVNEYASYLYLNGYK